MGGSVRHRELRHERGFGRRRRRTLRTRRSLEARGVAPASRWLDDHRDRPLVPPAEYPYRGKVLRARSTILGQAIHHATEHRAQIAGALATNGIDAIDLDALDVWAYGDAEGLGA